MIYIFWTCANAFEAEKIIRLLLSKKLIACANIIPEVISIYSWQGEIQKESEVKTIIKTQPELFQKVSSCISQNCSYDVPEITGINVDSCSPSYLQWLKQICNA